MLRQLLLAIFLMLMGGFGGITMRTAVIQSDQSERLRAVETRLDSLQTTVGMRTEDRYRSTDAARDFGFDRAEIAELKARLIELEKHFSRR